jgi:two-component SAPR family response regulator
MPIFTPAYNQGIAAFSRIYSRYLYEKLGEGGFLILDNFQDLCPDSATHQVIRQFIAEIPQSINVLVLSRSEPAQDYLRYRANGSIAVLDWQDIALSEEETKEFCQARLTSLAKKEANQIATKYHRLTRGWAAGLVLMLEQSRKTNILQDFAQQDDHSLIFDYFAGEIFQRETPDMMVFLLKTALLPFFSVKIAELLTHNADAQSILQNLTQRNYFTYSSDSMAEAYEYHPLFREFLLSRLETYFNARELREVQAYAGDLLVELGWLVEAADLYRQAKEWDKVATLVKTEGGELMRQGRHLLLRGWVQSVPLGYLNKDPWMEYWLAMSLQPVNTRDSRNHFVRAFESFTDRGDQEGQLLSWSGIIETYVHDLASFTELDQWIPLMEEIYKSVDPSIDAAVNARVSIAMFSALMYRQPDHKQIFYWEEKVRDIIFNTPNLTERLSLGTQLLLYYTVWTGELPKATVLRKVLLQSIDLEGMDPLSKILWHSTDATFLWKTGDASASIQSVKNGLEVANAFDVHTFDVLLLASGIYSSCAQNKLDQAEKYLQQMESRLNRNRLVDVVHYHYLATGLALIRGELGMAREFAEIALEAGHRSGALYPELLARLILSLCLIKQGKMNEVVFHLNRINDMAERIQSYSLSYLNRLVASEAAFSSDKIDHGVDMLKQAYECERDLGRVFHGFWWDMSLAGNCVQALEQRFEQDFIRELVRSYRLVPSQAPLHLDNWEWPVRIYTLGRFSVTRYGEALSVAAKSSKKPLELLKTLIAQGGRQVSQEALVEILWPDSEGDAGIQSLYTTTHRLRKLLSESGVVMQDGRLSLDARYIWVDNLAFLRISGKLQDLVALKNPEDQDLVQRLSEQFFHLYQGDFLGSDEKLFTYAPMQEKLHLRFLKLTDALGYYWQILGQPEKSIHCYERALEIDPVAEEFYQSLMQSYRNVGRDSDAALLFKRCRKNLSNILGISPSQTTLKIYNSIQK